MSTHAEMTKCHKTTNACWNIKLSHDNLYNKLVQSPHMIYAQLPAQLQNTNSRLFNFFLTLRPHHQMWFGNLNNQKGLVTSSQNTFCKFKLRDKTSADSTKAKQLRLQDKEVTKTQQGTPCDAPNFLEIKSHQGGSFTKHK